MPKFKEGYIVIRIIIYLIFNIILITDIVTNIMKIKSNNNLIKINEERYNIVSETNGTLKSDIAIREEHIEEHKVLQRKLDSVNRKLTILNKANYKKY